MLIHVILQLVDRLERGRTMRTGKHLRRSRRPTLLDLLQMFLRLAGTTQLFVGPPMIRIPEPLCTAFLATLERFSASVHIFVKF